MQSCFQEGEKWLAEGVLADARWIVKQKYLLALATRDTTRLILEENTKAQRRWTTFKVTIGWYLIGQTYFFYLHLIGDSKGKG